MTRDDIIRMAWEAWGDSDPSVGSPAWVYTMERFAALITAAKEAEHQQTLALQQRSYEREIELEVEAEREACARVCELSDEYGEGPDCWGWHAKDFAAAIRARRNT